MLPVLLLTSFAFPWLPWVLWLTCQAWPPGFLGLLGLLDFLGFLGFLGLLGFLGFLGFHGSLAYLAPLDPPGLHCASKATAYVSNLHKRTPYLGRIQELVPNPPLASSASLASAENKPT